MSWQPAIFNPLAFDSLSGSIAEELTKAPMTPLMTLPPFDGPGIYALYYSGGFRYYAPLSAANKREPGSWPIYIGKAEASTRKGIGPRAPDDYSGNALYRRLKKHTGSQSNPSAILMLRIFMSVRWCLHTFGYRWQRPRLSRCIGRCGIRWSMASVIMIREEGATKGCVRAGIPFTLGAGGLKSCVQTCIRHGRSARRLLPGWSSKHQNTESSHCRVSECDLVAIR